MAAREVTEEITTLRPMAEAPTTGAEILVATTNRAGCKGWLIVHYADGGGEEQPRFRGWFFWTGFDFQQIETSTLIGWIQLPAPHVRRPAINTRAAKAAPPRDPPLHPRPRRLRARPRRSAARARRHPDRPQRPHRGSHTSHRQPHRRGRAPGADREDVAMGVGLRLLPVDSLSGDIGYSHTILNVTGTGTIGMWTAIEALAPSPMPLTADISAFTGGRVPDGSLKGELTYGTLRTDAYGLPYTWISAGALVAVFTAFLPTHPITAYLKALPAETLVILDWH